MDSEMKISCPNDIRESLISFFKNKSLIPIVGAGFTCGSEAYAGKVPNGTEYKKHMIEELLKNVDFTDEEKSQLNKDNFSTLCDYYEDDEIVSPNIRYEYLKDNFYKANMSDDDVRLLFFDIEWPYIYSLNIDDAIENTSKYKRIILPNREFKEEIFIEDKCVIKLHGDIGEIVTYKKGGKIFTSKEYALSLDKNAPLLNKLRNDYKTQNILFLGCSLDDENDLKTLSTWPFDYKEKDNLSRTIIFVKGQPSKLQKSKYKTYGITDIVCFEDFDSMYRFLVDAWEEAQKIQEDELDKYNQINILPIRGDEIEKNQNYFLWGKGLYDLKNNIMNYPYFFISRNITNNILKNIEKNKVHLIYGSRLSGKSYLIADLYKTIRDRETFFLDGKSRITQKALEKLINRKSIVALFDIGTFDREQFEFILQNAQLINQNHNNFIINVNYNDSDTLGIVKWKLKQNIIQSTDILTYFLPNKFTNKSHVKELEQINNLLPAVNLPPYNESRTLLDQLIFTENILQKKGKYSAQHIKITTIKQLALLIVLAIKEKLYSLDIINYGFDLEIVDALKRYDPFIERVETNNYEKDSTDLSRVKYVLNSRYWLRRELGNYARTEENYKKIGEAYQYIIRKVIEFSGHNEYRQRKLCRNFILFDVMNDIFLDKYHGNLKLIVYVYTSLHELLAKDFHFLHQKAKCYLNYAYFLKSSDEKMKYLADALELAIISKTIIENKYEATQNERLQITMAHTQYTQATILSEICKEHSYSVIGENENTIDTIVEAILSPYNSDDYQRDRTQRAAYGIINFVQYAVANYDEFPVSQEYRKKLDNLVAMSIFNTLK